MKGDEPLVDTLEDGRVSWINHRFFKAFLVGFVIGTGILGAYEFRSNLMIQPQTMMAMFIADIGVPTIGVYLVANLVRSFLSRYGFEGYSKRDERITIAYLAISLVGLFLGPIILFLPFLFLIEILEKVGGDGFAGLVGLLMIGALALIALLRRAAQRRRSTQS